ncbi:MAG: Zn-ribbon domain-containing OB-fold protein [Candidatus Asgardarchaeia archaeon]
MSVPRYWREIPHHFRLIGTVCKNCGEAFLPPVKKCQKCGSEDLEEKEFPRVGKVLTYSIVYAIPRGFKNQKPYPIALIELKNGARIVAQLTDCDLTDIHTGMLVEAVFRRITSYGERGIIKYGYKFRPIMEEKTDQE